ncbi:unnamed protein product [Heligmosomoides polygyrus]|uniref:Uncharacterized protein n=1 Tax=Heligmosomoides polygyrus TaxID=6339 RepID=A0A3P8J087_HELPZ|nr:unnamed protein product [Heligmosomoides polygyrus]
MKIGLEVEVVSVRSISTYHGSGRAHVLRVWDGHQITPAHNLVGRLSSPVTEMTVAPWQWLQGVPEAYFFDVLLFGEWISRAATLKEEIFRVVPS